MITVCGFGDMYDDEHARACLACSGARRREYRYNHPGPIRLWLRRLFSNPKGYPLPPTSTTTEMICGELYTIVKGVGSGAVVIASYSWDDGRWWCEAVTPGLGLTGKYLPSDLKILER